MGTYPLDKFVLRFKIYSEHFSKSAMVETISDGVSAVQHLLLSVLCPVHVLVLLVQML